MKDRVWFNRKLFWDTMLQLRTMGITYFVICLVVSFMGPVVMSIGGSTAFVPIQMFTPVLVFLMTGGAVTMVFSAFSHLFSRRASDYFDALPTKRVAIAASRFSAVMAWLWGIVLVTAVSTTLSYGLMCGQWHWDYVAWICGYYGTVSLFFAAATLCGVSLTGTRFSAFIVSGLVAFTIRFLLLQFASAITYFAPVVSYHGFGLLLNPYSNIATATVMGVSEMANPYDLVRLMTTAGSMIYTFAVGLVYVAAGLWLYHIRKSETAEKGAPNPLLQTVYRCGITLPFILTFVLEYYLVKYANPEANIPGLIITALVSSLIVYLIFEIITQKKIKGLWKTLPHYVALMVFCVLFVFAAKSVANAQMHIALEPENVSELSMISKNYENSYADILIDDLLIIDPQINTLLVDALKNNVQGYDSRDYHLASMQSVTVRFHLKQGGSIVRELKLTSLQVQSLKRLLTDNKDYMRQLRRLPNASEIESYKLDALVSITQEQLQTLYRLLASDMQWLSDEDFASLMVDFQSGYPGMTMKENWSVGIIKMFGHSQYNEFRCYIDLTPKTPNALAYYIGIVKEQETEAFAKGIPAKSQLDHNTQFTLMLVDLKTGSFSQATENIQALDGKPPTLNDKQLAAFTLIRQSEAQAQSDYLAEIQAMVTSEESGQRNVIGQDAYYVYLTAQQAQTLQTLLQFE